MLAEPATTAGALRDTFLLPPELEAHKPPELSGTGRDDVRLLVTIEGSSARHARFSDLEHFVAPGDVLVLNRSETIPASLQSSTETGESFELHVSTCLPAGLSIVEPFRVKLDRPQRIVLPAGASANLLTPYPGSGRLWVARLDLPDDYLIYLQRHGHPIQYRHLLKSWPLKTFQNVFATEPGSAEMPSAGRPFTTDILQRLRTRGIKISFITLHAGVSSIERNEAPHIEHFNVPAQTAAEVNAARRRGSKVIGVGTTVVRALESSLAHDGDVVASKGWTDLVITPNRRLSSVTGLLTGFHEPQSSHLAMLEAVGGRSRVREAYAEALAAGYLWHEFGDVHLILSPSAEGLRQAA